MGDTPEREKGVAALISHSIVFPQESLQAFVMKMNRHKESGRKTYEKVPTGKSIT